jgi:CRISPR-associated protein Cmr4
MHAGKGTADQGVIDNLVQKDHTEELPCVYASSLKGAFREYFEEYVYSKTRNFTGEERLTQSKIDEIFGWSSNRLETEKKTLQNGDAQMEESPKKGNYVFHDALLLSIPVRSNKQSFFQATSPMAIKRIVETLNTFGLSYKELDQFYASIKDITENKTYVYGLPSITNDLQIEFFSGFDAKENNPLKNVFGDYLVVVHDETFKLLNEDYNLPIVARNQLENGESQNLFYEQIIPRQSKFFFVTNSLKDSVDFEHFLSKHVKDMPVQIGANASIGYGFCHVLPLSATMKGGNKDE